MEKVKEIALYKLILSTASVCFFLLFLYVALSRINYPFELEWMEGGSVDQMERLMNGQQIYTPPSLEYIPYIYTPMYYCVSAAVAKITGISLLPMRIVSFISTLLIGILILLFVKKETGDRLSGIISSGLFFACFGIGGAWYDLARVDMLWLLFYFAGIYFLHFNKTKTFFLVSAILTGLSFLTKQTALMLIAPVCIYLLIKERKLSWWFNVPLAITVVFSTLYFIYSSDGWYYFWNFTLPADHHWTKKFFILFWTYDLVRPMSLVLLLTVSLLVVLYKNNSKEKFYLFMSVIAGAVIASWFSRLHYGGWDNVLIPIYMILCVFSPIGLHRTIDHLSQDKNSHFVSRFLFLAMILQFIILIYSPFRQIPSNRDLKAGWELVNELKSTKGDVYVTGNTYYARLAGKKTYTHFMLIFDLMESRTKYNSFINYAFNNAIVNHKFEKIITYPDIWNKYPVLSKYYKVEKKANSDPALLWMKTGYNTRAEDILIPKEMNK